MYESIRMCACMRPHVCVGTCTRRSSTMTDHRTDVALTHFAALPHCVGRTLLHRARCMVDAVRCAAAAAGGLPLCGWAWGWRLAVKDCGMPLAARRALRCAGDGVGGKRPGEIPGHYLSVAKRHTAVRCLRCTSARPPTPAASMGGRRSSEGTTTWEGGGVHAGVKAE